MSPRRSWNRSRVAAAIVSAVVGSVAYTSVPEPKQPGYPFTSSCRVLVSPRKAFRGYANGGSGTLIAVNPATNKALVLTVKHVAERVNAPAKCQWGDEIVEGHVLATHPKADLALLLVDAPKTVQPVTVAFPSDGNDPFYLCGFPGYDRETLRYQAGNFIAVDYNRLTVDCRPEEGMSGGPAFDQSGRVVGAVSAYALFEQEGYCGSGKALFELLSPYIEK